MTPEERAKAIVDHMHEELGIGMTDPAWYEVGDVIAQAITAAENEKLEEAEIAILKEHSVTEPDDLNIGLLRAARAVKALRLSTTTSKD